MLGIPFLVQKMKNRYERSETMRSKGLAIHYTNNVSQVKNEYKLFLNKSILLNKS